MLETESMNRALQLLPQSKKKLVDLSSIKAIRIEDYKKKKTTKL